MKVQILYFASFRELSGTTSEKIELEAGASVNDLKVQILKKYPMLADQWPYAITTVNRKYVKPEHILVDGDEFGIMPPISGG